MLRSAIPRQPLITRVRRGIGMGFCASPNTRPKRRGAGFTAMARSAGAAEIYLSEALIGEPVGLVERQDGGWFVHYGPIALGVIDHRGDRLRRPKKACGLVDNPRGYPQSQRPNNHPNSYEQNRKTVTLVVGQICHLCRRLLSWG